MPIIKLCWEVKILLKPQSLSQCQLLFHRIYRICSFCTDMLHVWWIKGQISNMCVCIHHIYPVGILNTLFRTNTNKILQSWYNPQGLYTMHTNNVYLEQYSYIFLKWSKGNLSLCSHAYDLRHVTCDMRQLLKCSHT